MGKSVEEVRSEIPFLETGIIYLDNAATTPTPQPVIDAMLEYFQEYNANIGRGLHRATKRATEEFEAARGKVAETIGAKPEEIAYTKNATEALNVVANGLDLKKRDKVITTILEHHSNLIPWQRLERTRGIELKVVREAPDCVIDPVAIEDAVDDRTRLITMLHVSNAIGTIQPVEQIGEIAREHDILFLIDAAQAVGHMPIDVKETNCDFLAAPGHKGLLGPQGTGFLYIREDQQEELEPLLLGGGIVQTVSEHKCELVEPPQVFDAGTPNVPGIIGLGKAAEYVLGIGLGEIKKREQKLTQGMLKISEFDQVEVYGSKNPEDRGGVISFNLSGMDHHEVSSLLDEVANIATRSGHHCAVPVMNYLGVVGTVRASVHYYNTEDEVGKFVETIQQVAQELAG